MNTHKEHGRRRPGAIKVQVLQGDTEDTKWINLRIVISENGAKYAIMGLEPGKVLNLVQDTPSREPCASKLDLISYFVDVLEVHAK